MYLWALGFRRHVSEVPGEGDYHQNPFAEAFHRIRCDQPRTKSMFPLMGVLARKSVQRTCSGVRLPPMPRKNQDGKEIKLVLEWLCRRHFSDSELATALDIPPTNYGRRKDADDFPSYEELARFASYFGLSKRVLQIAFGLRDTEEIVLLSEDELRQYVEQGGGEVPPVFPTRTPSRTTVEVEAIPHSRRRQRRVDAPPGP